MDSTDNMRLQALMSRLCDGDIDTREISELSSRLENNEEAIQEYLAYTSLHLHLGHRLRPALSADEIEADIISKFKKDASDEGVAMRNPSMISRVPRRIALLAIAASLLLAAVVLIRSDSSQSEFTARIIQEIDCDWDEEHLVKPESADLEVGREIILDRGLMVLEFGNGTEVTLEAPIHFRVLAKDRGNLSSGKLTALVPRRGRGFAIQIPSGEVVDLGTHFGVMVDGNGNCETHVFEGNVVLRSDLGKKGQTPQEWKLAADEALRLSTTNEVERLSARPSSFMHFSRYMNPVPIEDRPSLKIPASSELVLWLDAARKLQLDDHSRVASWGDLCFGGNTLEDSAWQLDHERRPRWISDAIDGKPAVRFDGSSYLVTTPFLSGNDVTVICVFRGQPRDFPNRRAAQLLNLNGSSSLVLEHTRDNQCVGALVSDTQSEAQANSGRVEGLLPTAGEPVVCAYLYSSSTNRSSLYLNSELVDESQAPYSPSIRSPKYIGRSNEADDCFVGDICEILLFNSMLTPEQCIHISTDLMESYGIISTESEPRVLSGLVTEED